jgi:hypothetical protein
VKDDTILAAEESLGVPRSRVSTSMSSVGSWGKPQQQGKYSSALI